MTHPRDAACLDDDDVARLVLEPPSSRLARDHAAHLRSCVDCRLRIAAARATSADETDSTVDAELDHVWNAVRVRPGDRIDRYVIGEVLGEGGMGIVFAATDRTTGEERALKFMKADDIKATARFLREAHVAKTFVHDVVVPVLAVIDGPGGAPVLVMPRLHGLDLATFLAQRSEGSVAETQAIMAPLLDGVAALHALGAVHRDIKPANVFLEEGGRIRLLDFGLVRASGSYFGTMASLTTKGAQVGTLRYLPPEAFRDPGANAARPSIDVWGLGNVAFELVTGRKLYPTRHPGALFHAICERVPAPRADAVDSRIPSKLADAIGWMLEKDPSKRAPSAVHALAAWERASTT